MGQLLQARDRPGRDYIRSPDGLPDGWVFRPATNDGHRDSEVARHHLEELGPPQHRLHQCHPEIGPREGKHAPNFEATAIDGRPMVLNQLLGKPVVLVFWASWCGPCRQEAPEIAALASRYGDQVQFLSVNAGEDGAVVKRAAGDWGITWPVVPDVAGAISRAYSVQAIPLVLVLDADGLIRYRGNGLPSDPHRLLDGLSG